MPLPDANAPWPPTDPCVQSALADWDAWYSSDPDRLSERYQNRGIRGLPDNRPSQYRGGVRGRFARWWWGSPTPLGERRAKLHVPLAGDIARVASDLLFSEPPSLTAESAVTQERLTALAAEGLHPTLLEAGAVCAALGGVALRVVWDRDVSPRAWLSVVHADGVAPEFRYGRLRAATVWSVVRSEGTTVWRHLERHEPGRIFNGLYRGTTDNLGRRVELDESDATEGLAQEINTGVPGHLTISYVPNMRPARAWRNIPSAAHLGQSDYQGVEGIFDALDETYSSWMRDVRIGKGRMHVPRAYLESNGPGRGAGWDEDREVYAPLNTLPGDGMELSATQFEIRVAEHRDTCRDLIEQAVRQAGYSASTFGLGADGPAVTATEIRARQRNSMTTRARKGLYWASGLADSIEALLAVEAGLLGSGVPVERPSVVFQDSISESLAELAETANLLRQADAASTERLVRLVNPGIEGPDVQAEVARILAEAGRAVPDPADAGRDDNADDERQREE